MDNTAQAQQDRVTQETVATPSLTTPNISFNAAIIQTMVNGLYSQADTIVATYALIGAVVGGVLGYALRAWHETRTTKKFKSRRKKV